MILNYIKPQAQIRQFLETGLSNSLTSRHAFILGPQYHLARYKNALERADMLGVDFSSTGVDVPFEGFQSNYQVDSDSVELYGEGLEASLVTFPSDSGSNRFNLNSLSEPNKIRLNNAGTGVAVRGDSLASEFLGRDVEIGDLVYVTYDSNVVKRTVVGFEKEATKSRYGSDAGTTDSLAKNNVTNPATEDDPVGDLSNNPAVQNVTVPSGSGWTVTLDSHDIDKVLALGPTLDGSFGDRYTVTITQGGDITSDTVKFKVRSSSGTYSEDDLTVTHNASNGEFLFNGISLQVSVNETVYTLGNQFSFSVIFPYEQLTTTDGGDVDVDGTYTGSKDTTYIIEVIKGGVDPVVKVYDVNGIDTTTNIDLTLGTTYNLGSYGLTFKIENISGFIQGKLKTGDKYFLNTIASSKTGVESIIVLDGYAADTIGWVSGDVDANYLAVEFVTPFNGEIDPKRDLAGTLSWTVDQNKITVESGLKHFVSERSSGNEWVSFKDGVGKLFSSYRAFVPNTSNELVLIKTSDDINTHFGIIDPENELAFGLSRALSGAQGKPVYGYALKSNDQVGYNDGLRFSSKYPSVYAITPLTYDINVINSVKSHVESLSSFKNNKWRRSYVGAKNPGKYAFVTTNNGEVIKAAIQNYNGNNVRLTSLNGDFVTNNVKSGDLIRINYSTDVWGDVTYDEYEIDYIVGENELILVSGPATPITTAIKFEVWKPDTGLTQAEYIAGISSSIGSRRVNNVWLDSGSINVNGDIQEIEQYYSAAEISGLRTALLPQQGLTNTEISSVSNATKMYTKYTDEELNIAAQAGTFIITQDAFSGSVYIRHQLTTDTDNGSLYYEDSIGANLDEISYEFYNIVAPYIGKRNATQYTIREIRNRISDMLFNKTDVEAALQSIGPQIANVNLQDLVVEIDPVRRDTINIKCKVELPHPINNILVDLTAAFTV